MDIKLEVTNASEKDARDLFEWRNDPVTRAMSIQTGKLQWEDHLGWFKKSLESDDRSILIFWNENNKIGMGRIDMLEGVSILSWMISPNARGKGYGRELVKKLADVASGPKRAMIKADNFASIKIAEHVGFERCHEKDGILTFEM